MIVVAIIVVTFIVTLNVLSYLKHKSNSGDTMRIKAYKISNK